MKRLMLLSVFLVFSLVAAAITPGVVLAEGDIPEAPPPEPEVVEESLPENTSSAVELLAEAGAVIASPGGEVVPLASQAALEVICDPDPWFYCSVGCVGGKSPSYATINLALENWVSKKGYGFIFLEGGYNNDLTVKINGDTYPTLKGIVWDKTTPGAKPQVNGLLEIYNFKTGFTLQGFSKSNNASDAIYLHGNSGPIKLVDIAVSNPGGYGIFITSQKGPVSLNNVSVMDSKYHGLYIYNTYNDGTKYVNTGNVTVTNSAFLRNGGVGLAGNYTGLTIHTAGSIVLNGVTAYGNEGDGGDFIIYGVLPLTIRNSVFSNSVDNPDGVGYGFGIYTFINTPTSPVAITLDNVTLIGNEAAGALLRTGGNITLNKVYSANNSLQGVYISGDYDSDSVGAKNVTVTNSTFISNQDNNLEVHASGAVKVVNLYSLNSASESGLNVVNTYGSLPAAVTIQGAVVTGNGSRGLYVWSKGAISLSGITSLNNGLSAWVDNSPSSATPGITMSGALGVNRFNGTYSGNGLMVDTNGNAVLNSIQANDNASFGVLITGHGAASNVTLSTVEASGNRGVAYKGISIITSGAVTISKATVLNNEGQGIYVDNTGATYSRPVTISNSVVFHNGYTGATDNNKKGIYVLSAGQITLSNVTASGNSLTGADLDNTTQTSPATQVYQGVTVLKSTFDLNNGIGLSINSMRKITLTSINASENSYRGVSAYNNFSEVHSAIVVNGTNRINHNGRSGSYHGIGLESSGPVTISGITAAWNTVDGLYVYTTASVIGSNIQVIGNSGYGVEIDSSGLVTLTGITALQNGTTSNSSGVYVYNPAGKVRVNSGLIMGNGAYGLRIHVAIPATDAYVAPGVVVFGNDVVSPYEGKQIWIY